jgi:DNA-binding IclR family transcriptional regulator
VGRRSEIDILASFDTVSAQSATEIVQRTGLPRSTVFRALRLLVEAGFVNQESGSRQYVLGNRMLQLGLIAREQHAPSDVIIPPLLALGAQTHETITFSLVDIPWRLCVFVLDAPSDLRSVAVAGTRYALHLGAASSAILANLPAEVATETLRYHGVPERKLRAQLAHLEEIRAEGAVVSVGQRVAGASSVASAVKLSGTVYGAIAIAGPSERMAPKLDEFKSAVIKVGAELSERLSSPPEPEDE